MQESMILSAVVSSFPEAMVIGAEVYQNLKKVIKEKYRKSSINVSNENIKFAPNTLENKEAPEVLKNAIAKASYTVISIEAAAAVFSRSGKYDLDFKSLYVTPDQLVELHMSFIWKYALLPIDHPFDHSFGMEDGKGKKIEKWLELRCMMWNYQKKSTKLRKVKKELKWSRRI